MMHYWGKNFFYGVLLFILTNCDGSKDGFMGTFFETGDSVVQENSADSQAEVLPEDISEPQEEIFTPLFPDDPENIIAILDHLQKDDLQKDDPEYMKYFEELHSDYQLISEFYPTEIAETLLTDSTNQNHSRKREHRFIRKIQKTKERLPIFYQTKNRGKYSLSLEQGSSSESSTDTYTQKANQQRALDIVVVLDNSGSMRERLSEIKIKPLLKGLDTGDIEVRVTTTSSYRKDKKKSIDPTKQEYPPIEGSLLKSSNKKEFGILSKKFDSIIEKLINKTGEAKEKGLLSALASIEAAPLREEAALIILVVSDEDEDCSLYLDSNGNLKKSTDSEKSQCLSGKLSSYPQVTSFLENLKKKNKIAGQNFFFYGIFIDPNSSDAQSAQTRCKHHKSYTHPAYQYLEVLKATGGICKIESTDMSRTQMNSCGSVCANPSEYAGMLESIAKHLKVQLKSRFPLSHSPTVIESLIVNGVDRLDDGTYRIDQDKKLLIFDRKRPKKGEKISIQYQHDRIRKFDRIALTKETGELLEGLLINTLTMTLNDKSGNELVYLEKEGELVLRENPSFAIASFDPSTKEIRFGEAPKAGTIVKIQFEADLKQKSEFCDQDLLLPDIYEKLEVKVNGQIAQAVYEKDSTKKEGCLSFADDQIPPADAKISGSYQSQKPQLLYPLALQNDTLNLRVLNHQGEELDKDFYELKNNLIIFYEDYFSLEDFRDTQITVQEIISESSPGSVDQIREIALPSLEGKEILYDTINLKVEGKILCDIANESQLKMENNMIVLQAGCEIPKGSPSIQLTYLYIDTKLFVEDPQNLLKDENLKQVWLVHMNQVPLDFTHNEQEHYVELKELPVFPIEQDPAVVVSVKLVNQSNLN